MYRNVIHIKNKKGFVALFFVLVSASSFAGLSMYISLKSENMLRLLSDVRIRNNVRASAKYCLEILISNKMDNIGYRPEVGVDIPSFTNFICRYESYDEIPAESDQTLQEYIVDGRRYKTLQRFTVVVVGSIANTVLNNRKNIENNERDESSIVPEYRVSRTYAITDSL